MGVHELEMMVDYKLYVKKCYKKRTVFRLA